MVRNILLDSNLNVNLTNPKFCPLKVGFFHIITMFGQTGFSRTSYLGGGTVTAPSTTSNPMKDFAVTSPPDDTVSCMAFSPATIPQNFLIAGSWDNNVRCWEVDQTGNTIPKSQQTMQGPVLDVAWSDVRNIYTILFIKNVNFFHYHTLQDGSKVFMAGCDKMAKCWDLTSDQSIQVCCFKFQI